MRELNRVLNQADKEGKLPRRMADAGFRDQQWLNRYSDHIAPINRLVNELRNDGIHGWAPYVAPMYGGVNARLLSALRDPGPRTRTAVFSVSKMMMPLLRLCFGS